MRYAGRRSVILAGAYAAGAGLLEQSILRAAQATALSASTAPGLFNIQKVADGVYAAIAKPAALINCNAVIFENHNDILIVDAHSKPSASAALVAEIRRGISHKPVRYIVNTHFHWDHVQGMATYRKVAPGADVLASAATRVVIEQQAVKRLAASLESSRAKLEQTRRSLETARTAEEKAYCRRFIAELEGYLREMQGWTPELPHITFDDHLVIHDRAHEIHLVFKGRAHTGGDICVYCPSKKLIATADVLSSFIPGMYDGYPLEWSATLARIGELEFEQVIPGHGDVHPGKKRLHQERGYIDEVIEAVRTGKQQGRGVAELQKTITAATVRAVRDGEYGAYVESSVARHMLLAPGVTPRDTMANSIRTNVANIYHALESSPGGR